MDKIKKPPEGGYNDITTLLLLIIQLIFHGTRDET